MGDSPTRRWRRSFVACASPCPSWERTLSPSPAVPEAPCPRQVSGEPGGRALPEKGCQGPPPHPFLNLPSLPSRLSIPVSFCFSGRFLLSPHPPFLSPFSVSLHPPLPSSLHLSPSCFSLCPLRPSARRRDGRTTTHYCTAAAAYAPRPTDRARAFGPSLRGSSRDYCLLQPPAGLGLLLGGLRASFPGHHGDHHFPGIPVLPGGPPPISHPQVPLLCFYILNWRFIFNIYYLRRALCCEGGPGVVSGVLPAWHPLPGSHPPRCLCASCLSPLVHSFRAFTVFPQAPPPHPSQLPPPTPMVSHSAGHPTSTLLSVLLFL